MYKEFFLIFFNLTFCKRNNANIIFLIIFCVLIIIELFFLYRTVILQNKKGYINMYGLIYIYIYLYIFLYIYIFIYIKIFLPGIFQYQLWDRCEKETVFTTFFEKRCNPILFLIVWFFFF